MTPIYINSVGIMCSIAKNFDELLINYSTIGKGKHILFNNNIPNDKLRRASRYVVMSSESVQLCINDFKDELNIDDIGTVFLSNYGPIESNLKFSKDVINNNPMRCSPATFPYTVVNSCVGQICMIYGFKNYSTMFVSGNLFDYSSIMLHKIKYILCGSIDEYNDDLIQSLKYDNNILLHTKFSEGATSLLLSNNKIHNNDIKIINTYSTSFKNCPYLNYLDKDYSIHKIKDVLNLMVDYSIDLILDSSNDTYFDEYENESLNDIFHNVKVISPKKIFGETFGNGFLSSIAYGKAILNNNLASSILVTNVDMQGNYQICILQK